MSTTQPAPTNENEPGHSLSEMLAAIEAARSVSFSLGRTLITPGARDALLELGLNPARFMERHHRGEWGDLSEDDRRLNDQALKDGSRIFSSYRVEGLKGDRVWVITEAEDDEGRRAATTILLPSEY